MQALWDPSGEREGLTSQVQMLVFCHQRKVLQNSRGTTCVFPLNELIFLNQVLPRPPPLPEMEPKGISIKMLAIWRNYLMYPT